MENDRILAKLRDIGFMPILRTLSADEALRLGELLMEAGVRTVEIPLTVPGAFQVIEQLAWRFGNDGFVGAGTVLGPEDAHKAIDVGAAYIVSPGLDFATIAACKEEEVPVFAGALSPTEIIAAHRAGADMVKVFPCDAVGGPSYIKALKAPLPQIELIPTGGVTLKTALSYLEAGASILGVGSDLVDLRALAEGHPEIIIDGVHSYLEIVQEYRKHHR
jgi:2-dehydro-3-deoxyphosphogluconate aldolase / (4S)-4-hydroxy-2-oxoglutarate aldolase